MQNSGVFSQLTLQRNSSHDIHPIGGVAARLLRAAAGSGAEASPSAHEIATPVFVLVSERIVVTAHGNEKAQKRTL
jgi:hypothetical protein